MKLFDVYPLYDVTPVSAKGSVVTDNKGQEYLDLYGGHAVISIGHSHPTYISRLKEQLDKIGFYSNAIQNPVHKNWRTNWANCPTVNTKTFFFVIRGRKPTKML